MRPSRFVLATFVSAATLAASLALSPQAAACGTSEDVVVDPPRRPIGSSSLLERAAALEAEARSHERQAARSLQEAARLAQRATALRVQASRVSGEARGELLAFAARLDRDAAGSRADAADAQLEATRLQQQASDLRRVAARPPGWRTRPTTALLMR